MSKRETIITTAMTLFNQKSYTSIGVDKIIAESKVAKMTFYKYFSSKEVLIEEEVEYQFALANAFTICDAY
ncbi:TetR family transcriptional regulator, partial [Acinetobacter baumannii]